MCFRTYKNTDLTVSEVGFGMWTISTGWWGKYTEGEALALMHKAFDLGITLFDAADTYGNGMSEEYIAKAFPKNRDEIVVATKVGYDFVTHVGADTDPIEKAGVPAFGPMQDNRFYFNYHHTAADTLDKIVPRELQENAGVVAVAAYAFANAERPLPREK